MGTGQAPDSISRGYVFDNAAAHAGGRFRALSEIRHLGDRGIQEGWRCLEVGGGGGSIARWLSEQVGPTGHVLVTDIDTRFLETLNVPNIEVRRHNIASDPLPEGAFDLVHASLVLIHLPELERVLARLVGVLKPEGWLVDEEFDALSMPADPGVNPREVFLKTRAAMERLLTGRGADPCFGRTLFTRLGATGLLASPLKRERSCGRVGRSAPTSGERTSNSFAKT
jgi:SAM-dependent methyltransferase